MLLLCSALLGPHPGLCAQGWAAQHKGLMGILERVQPRTTEMTEGLEHLPQDTQGYPRPDQRRS